MSVLYETERSGVAAAARRMLDAGLVVNTSGNVSVRIGEHVAITPSNFASEDLRPTDIVVLDLESNPVDGDLLPSSETELHLSLYRGDKSVGAVVHTHSVYATAISTLVDVLPAIHYQIANLGGPVPVAPYRTFGSPELASVVSETMQGRFATLMQNHGSVTVGDTVGKALSRTITLEWLSRVYLIAHQSGSPSLLDDEEIERVKAQQAKFRGEQARRIKDRTP